MGMEHKEQLCPANKMDLNPRKLLSFLLVRWRIECGEQKPPHEYEEKAWGKHVRSELKDRELWYMRELKTAAWNQSLSQPTLKGWSTLQEEPVRYFLTGDFRTVQETWITLKKWIYFFCSLGSLVYSLSFPQPNGGALCVHVFVYFDIRHSVSVKSQADHCQLKFPSFEINSISKEQWTGCHYWG